MEIEYIEKNILYNKELLIIIKKLLNITEKNTYNTFEEFEIIYKYLNHNLYKCSKIEKEQIKIQHFKLIYSVSIFILTQLKIIFRIPSSMQKLHNEIIQEICKINGKYMDFLNNIEIESFYSSNNKNNNNFYENLLNEYSNKNNNENYSNSKIENISNNLFKKLIDIIHNKLFGKKSNIIIYFKSQGNILFENESFECKKYKSQGIINTDSNNDKNLKNNYSYEDFDNIIIEEEKNANDTALITVNESKSNILDMSLRDKKNNNYEDDDDESETVSKYSDTSSQNINIPEIEDELNFSKYSAQSRKSIENSYFGDDYLSNIKI